MKCFAARLTKAVVDVPIAKASNNIVMWMSCFMRKRLALLETGHNIHLKG